MWYVMQIRNWGGKKKPTQSGFRAWQHLTGVFLSSKTHSLPHSLFLSHPYYLSNFDFQALQKCFFFCFWLSVCVFVLFKVLSISLLFFSIDDLHCLFPSTCCMSALFTRALPSSPCMLVFTCLLHVRLVCTCFAIIALHACLCLCAYFRLLVACPPHLHLLHHHRLACLLPPSCYMFALFAAISLLSSCVNAFTHVLISTYSLLVYLICTYSTITTMCAYFRLLASYPLDSCMFHHRRLMCLLLPVSLLPPYFHLCSPPSTIAIRPCFQYQTFALSPACVTSCLPTLSFKFALLLGIFPSHVCVKVRT